jgi:hypothetical protein
MHTDTFKRFVNDYVDNVLAGSVIVEIGSDRYEGSTNILDQLAQKYNTKLLSVDLFDDAKNRIGDTTTNTEFIVGHGSTWAKNYKGPPISLLFLDNFDYQYDVKNNCNSVYQQQQIDHYQSVGITMTNNNCQVEHMSQMLHLYKHLTLNAVIMFDDTYTINDCWVGKCGPVVVFLQAQGWKILENTTDTGVVLIR